MEQYVEQSGPFDNEHEEGTALSRCPDEVKNLHANLTGRVFTTSATDPDDNNRLVHFDIRSEELFFTGYVVRGAIISKANYRLLVDKLSNDLRYKAPKNGTVLMSCRNGAYYGSGALRVYRGSLRLESIDPIQLSGIGDDPAPPPGNQCDDPLTEIVETDCEGGGGGSPVSGGSDGSVQATGEFEPPPSGGSSTLTCDVTFWYESRDGGATWFYTGEYTVHWETCTLN